MNSGKRFEADVQKSCPPDGWMYRLRDNPATYGDMDNSALRFASDNICDFVAFRKPCFYLIECKTVGTPSASLTAMFGKVDGGRYKKQKHLEDMLKASSCEGLHSCVLINFRRSGTTYALSPLQCLKWLEMSHQGGRKSIPESWCKTAAKEVQGRKLKVNWRWDLESLMDRLEEEECNQR